jgi:hypothetical protein
MSTQLPAEVERLRAQVAELLPYALAGAEALDFFEPYGLHGEAHVRLCEGARVMLDRIKAGEFGTVERREEGEGA